MRSCNKKKITSYHLELMHYRWGGGGGGGGGGALNYPTFEKLMVAPKINLF